MKFFNVVQGSVEWHALRKGIPTASCFDRIITPAKRKYSASAFDYIAQLIAEKRSEYEPERAECYTSKAMIDGIETEAEARNYLAMDKKIDITNGGFCLADSELYGASPDGLIGDDGVVEIKCPAEKTHAGYLLKGGLPPEYVCQVQGELLTTGRKYCLFVSYVSHRSNLPPHIVRVEPDPTFISDLEIALIRFNTEYLEALKKIQAL